MKLHGCTEEQETFRAEYTPEEIVDSGIDPWRLDLLDPNPIKRKVDGTDVYFRKLENFSFAYRVNPEYVVVGQHDGTNPVCLIGRQVGTTSEWDTGIAIEGYRLSDKPFHHHLKEYLALLTEKPCPTTPGGTIMGSVKPSRDDGGRPTAYRPRPLAGISMNGGEIIYGGWGAPKSANEFTATTYVGAMHEQVPLPGTVCEKIAWAFRHFQAFEPIVFGAAVRRAIKGEPVDRVDVLLRDGEYGELRDACEKGFIWVGDNLMPVHHGCIHKVRLGETMYYLYNRRLLVIPNEPFGYCSIITSADNVFCRDGATFGGTRIACNDIPQAISRPVSKVRPALGFMRQTAESAMEVYLKEQLTGEGFRLRDYPDVPDTWGKWEDE